jgi:hypothetical protein
VAAHIKLDSVIITVLDNNYYAITVLLFVIL